MADPRWRVYAFAHLNASLTCRVSGVHHRARLTMAVSEQRLVVHCKSAWIFKMEILVSLLGCLQIVS
jgi:hypothetical protein